MPKNWKAFLSKMSDDVITLQDTATSTEMLFDLSHRGLIKVSGEDAESFLQNQFSNDITHINENTHQISAWCNPKGRIIANFRIFKQGNAFFLSLSADLLEAVLKKLQMYVMMSKVTLEDMSDSFAHFGYIGTLPLDNADNVPTGENQTSQHNGLSILAIDNRDGTSNPRYEIFGEVESAKKLWEECSRAAKHLDIDAWDYFNIQSGLPEISAVSSEAWIPQMVNFIAVGGVDFKKGCYPGQEIVARLNYLGKTKRRMYRLLIDSAQLPEIGDSITSITNDVTDNDAGKILNTALNPDGNVEALAVLKIAETDKALTLTKTQTKISLLKLPYSLDKSE